MTISSKTPEFKIRNKHRLSFCIYTTSKTSNWAAQNVDWAGLGPFPECRSLTLVYAAYTSNATFMKKFWTLGQQGLLGFLSTDTYLETT